MGWFFTKAALLTFGGAYAVLPYVYQGGVEHYGWLSGSQMIDGLALGETTPGPLIMIVAFVGFVGGWTKQVFGPELLPWAGVVGACVATYFTFLPSFLFILIGGPAVEATRHQLAFTAPLTAITAAVVGVIVNLALFFAYHVLWPQGFAGGFEVFAAVIGVAACIALFRFKIGVIPVIGACAAAGLLYSLLTACRRPSPAVPSGVGPAGRAAPSVRNRPAPPHRAAAATLASPTSSSMASPRRGALQCPQYKPRRAHHQRERSMASNYLESVEIEPSVPARASVIWLPGLGADGHGMRAWYDITGFDSIRKEDEAGMQASAGQVNALIARERERGIAAGRILLAGFSQGGAVALHTGQRHHERLAGILALSTYLPLAASVGAEAQPANRAVPIFMAHGSEDTVIALPRALMSQQRLEERGYPVELHCYPMSHCVCNEEFVDIRRFIARTFY